MSYWKSKVLPKIKKVFDIDKDGKKAAAVEFCKSFDGCKEEITKEVEGKKIEITTKVVETYEASPAEIKSLVKDRKAGRVKKYSVQVTKFIEDLVVIEFPGAKQVSEAAAKSGPALVSGPVLFIFEKVSTFVVTEEPKPEPPAEPAPAEETTREVVVEEKEEIEEKVEETPAPPAEPAPEPAPAAPAAEPAKPTEEPPKA
ncbi:salt stress root protein RS1-like [Typha latifolia]|uniref:salt stress root protein RS1-like n=1 Tax=Typha latifolia TaxID=4733 RepID=UPI003C2B05F7